VLHWEKPHRSSKYGGRTWGNDIAFRCNFVTLCDNDTVMEDFTAHHISNEDAKKLIVRLQVFLAEKGSNFIQGLVTETYSLSGMQNLI